MMKPLQAQSPTYSQLPTRERLHTAYTIMCNELRKYVSWSATLRPGRILRKYFPKVDPHDAVTFIIDIMEIKYFNVQCDGRIVTWKAIAKERQPSKNSVTLRCKRLKRPVQPNLQ